MGIIAERMKHAMEVNGIKQADLVSRTGIGKSSISTYLAGDYEPKQKNIYKIAKALNVNEGWLMGEDVPMERIDIDEYLRMIRELNKAENAAVDNLGMGVTIAGTKERCVVMKTPRKSDELCEEEMALLIKVVQITLQDDYSTMRSLRILSELIHSLNIEDQDKLISYAEFLDSERQKRFGISVQHPYQTE